MIRTELTWMVRCGLLSTGFLAPLAVGLLLRMALAEGPTRAEPASEPAVTPCEATRMDATCPPGERCAAGRCLAARLGERAGRDEGCGGRPCGLGLECHRGACLPIGSFPVAPAVCRRPAIRAKLDELLNRCTQARRGQRSLLLECDADAWLEMSKDSGFEELVMSMPGAFSVFFPNALPDPDRKWPGAEVHTHYADGIRRHAGELGEAQALLIIGRASNVGEPALNFALAQRRAELVESLVREVLGPSMPEIRAWGLASDFKLSTASMRQRMPAEPIAATEADELVLRAMRAPEYVIPGDEISDMLNRVVFVVPLPCDGHEFNPAPAFCGVDCKSEVAL